MTETPHAAKITVLETLNLLESSFKTFADGIADGRYVFWLGSGISRERFPMLDGLVEKVLEYLRSKTDLDNPACPYRQALERALDLAILSEDERNQIEFFQPVSSWSNIDLIKARLTEQYTTLLDIDVGSCDNDILVWEGIDVVGTYGDPGIEPDAEHLCLAVLLREGIVSELASANWDGLIEKAVRVINGGESPLSVCVRSEDLQDTQNSPKLIKFHGCAVRASEDEKTYRRHIVCRKAQISNWANEDRVKALADHLKVTIRERPTLMIGLSAQDFNIQNLFGTARATLGWSWPSERPSHVFSEQDVTHNQRILLEIVYRDEYEGAKREEIIRGSQIQAFAKPLLLALIFYVLCEKLARLAKTLPATENPEMADWISAGAVSLRNAIAIHDEDDRHAFTEKLIRGVTRLRRLVSVGDANDDVSLIYEALTLQDASKIERNVETESNGLPEVGVAVAILGHGIADNLWTVKTSDGQAAMAGIKTGDQETRLFVAANDRAEQNFYTSGRLKGKDNAILVRAQPSYDRPQRSPMKELGRTGRLRTREVSISDLLEGTPSPDEVMEKFRRAAAL